MAWPARRDADSSPPKALLGAVAEGRERVLASSRVEPGARWVLATTYGLVEAGPDAGVLLRRPWHDVDAASWSRDAGTLTVTWVDRSRPGQWALADERLFLQVVRERVQASVVLAETVTLPSRRVVRAVIRQDLASRALLEQVVLGRGGPLDRPAEAAVAQALERLREQTGMPPRGG
ncbi:MAG: hypothetical protein ACOYBY_14280 [Dermatophilaceae bacterium]